MMTGREQVAPGMDSGGRTAGGDGRRMLVAALVVLALSVGVRLPFLVVPTEPSPDATEYLDVARHLAHGGGLTLSIKSHLADQKPVVRSTIGNRSPVYPVLVAAGLVVFRLADELTVARAVNLVLSAVGCVVCLLLFVGMFGWRVGVLSAVLVAINPWLVVYGVSPLSDQLAFTVSVAALGLYARNAREGVRPAWSLSDGAMAGLGYLVRPTGLVLLAVLAAGYVIGRRWRGLLWLVVGALLVTAPYLHANWRLNGSPLYSVYSYNYAVGESREATWSGLDRGPVAPSRYIRSHSALVAKLIWRRTQENLGVMASQVGLLLPLVLLLPAGWWRRERGVMAGYAAANLACYCLSWAAVGAYRYLLASYLLPLPLLLEAAARPRWRVLARAGPVLLGLACVVAVVSFGRQDADRYRRHVKAAQARPAVAPLRAEVAEWLRRETGAEAVVASNNPWLINYLTHRPAVICPEFSREDQVVPFLRGHDVSVIVLFVRGPDERVEFLNSAGVAETVRLVKEDHAGPWRVVVWRVEGPRPSGDARQPRAL